MFLIVGICSKLRYLMVGEGLAPPEKILKFNKREHQGAPLPAYKNSLENA